MGRESVHHSHYHSITNDISTNDITMPSHRKHAPLNWAKTRVRGATTAGVQHTLCHVA